MGICVNEPRRAFIQLTPFITPFMKTLILLWVNQGAPFSVLHGAFFEVVVTRTRRPEAF